ncbi:malonyl-CoA/methylmalonyl-CoA synthetase [Tistlia consotensis]|uniref:Malonyl-CoA/methylmalonyl-CoA synthetase n=1 Tax=Tistlia consotensis USBA 355 TaxID=560819 RepID=A0A1Y6C3V9_9PROT|nr:malonyl-CoA synthase [Tistlia consotensis]SMF43946.1 malonyl-CoA/methylmalonyl-CoA synthetase [Tistlia consotensis USBA 355]SNR42972.1 malonyl-CoA/methylmalonyl-CoA synthetase [Tistlia consotensis]
MNQNLFAILRDCFPADRSRPAIVQPGGAEISYGELEAAAGRYAAVLRRLGCKPGDRVAVQVDKSVEAVFLYLGCAQAGCVYLPLNVAYTADEVAYFLGDAGPALFVCRPEAEAKLKPVAEGAGVAHLMTLDAGGDGTLAEAARAASPDGAVHEAADDDLAAILYTSGTTGRSKGAMLTHGNLSSNALTLRDLWGFREGDALLHALPIFHVHGLFVALNTSLANGSKIFFLPKFDADEILRLMPQATVMMGVPTFYVRLLQHPGFTKEAAAGMRLFISGSAPLLEETFHEFEQRIGLRILERYGMTEVGMACSNPYEEKPGRERRAGTVGFPLPGVEVRIADSEGRLLGTDEIGVLEMRGPNVFKGYWQMPEKTKEEFRPDGFFISGDLSKIDADGYVHIVGRAKDLVISGGFNVYPKEIELVVDEIPGVGESAIIGLPHPDFGEAVAAVCTRTGGQAVEEAEIIAVCKQKLANFKVPKRVFFVETLPRNTMGKVQKAELRKAFAETFKGA